MARGLRLGILLISVALVVPFAAGGVPDVLLTVDDVSVDPDSPVPGDPVRISPTIDSSVGSDGPVSVDAVRLTVEGETVRTAENVGALAPGDDVDVPFTTRFDEHGVYEFTVHVEGTDDDGNTVTVTHRDTLTVVAVADVRLTVDDVDVEPATPTAGAPVTLPVTVASSVGSNRPVTVDSLALIEDGETVVEATDLGSLAPGDAVTVPLTPTFDRAGVRDLTVRFTGTNPNGEEVGFTRPVTVVVEEGAPVITPVTDTAVRNVTAPVSVRVANPTEAVLRNVSLSAGGESVTQTGESPAIPVLQPGETVNRSLRVRPETTGNTGMTIAVNYTTAAGTTASFTREAGLAVEPVDESVALRATTIEEQQDDSGTDLGVDVPGVLQEGQDETAASEGDIRVTVSNVGNAPVTNVVLDPVAGGQSLGQRPVTDRLPQGREASVVVSLERAPPSAVEFRAQYDVAGKRSTTATGFETVPERGAVTITGVDIEENGETVEISGDVGNPGSQRVSGVIVAVGQTDSVSPAYPGRDFFVGAVEGDAFAPFELRATLEENASAVPIEVTYIVAGDERSETVRLPVSDFSRETSRRGPSGALQAAIALLLASLLAVIAVFVRRA
jgi:hypothetical protein